MTSKITSHEPILHPRKEKDRVLQGMREHQGPDGRISKVAPTAIPRSFTGKTSDKLTPTPTDPTVHISDKGAWTVDIEGIHDTDSSLSMTEPQRGSDYDSLDNAAIGLYRSRPYPKLSKNDPERQKHHNVHSITSQYDIVARPKLEPQLAKKMGFHTNQNALATQHILLKNGLADSSYQAADGTIVTPKYAIAGSQDRESPRLQMARRIAPLVDDQADPKAPSYCYTGRPDTPEKALEQGKMIFFAEMDSDAPKGISSETDEDGEEIYTLTYLVSSIESNSRLYNLIDDNERRLFKNEEESLKMLQDGVADGRTAPTNGVYEITHPVTHQTYKVRFQPLLFSRQVNLFANLEKAFNGGITGKSTALDASRKAWNEFTTFASHRLDDLDSSPKDRELAKALIAKIEASMNKRMLWGKEMGAVEELTCLAMLCVLLDLPIAYHCKSSTDRTSIVVALHVSLCQWIKQGLPLPDGANFEKIVDNEYFKELIALNWVQGHQITRNSRAPEGIITQNGFIKELDHEVLGISAGSSVAQCNLLSRLLPKRYLKDYGTIGLLKDFWVGYKETTGNWFWPSLIVGVPLLVLIWVGAGLANMISTMRHPNGTLWRPTGNNFSDYIIWFGLGLFRFIYRTPLSFLSGLLSPFRIAPDQVINLEALGVGPRRLVKDAQKEQNDFNMPIEAVPANAGKKTPKELDEHMKQVNSAWKKENLAKKSPVEIYDLFFEKRFVQKKRPVRHFLKGNVIEHAKTPFETHESDVAKILGKVKVGRKQWKIKDPKTGKTKAVHSLNDFYSYLRKKRHLSEERAIEFMKKKIPALRTKKLHIDTRKNKILKTLRKANHTTWQIDNTSFKNPAKIYEYLTKKKKLGEEHALDILWCMQKGMRHYADSYLKTTLESGNLSHEVNIKTRHCKDVRFHLDTTKLTLAIENDKEVYNTKNDDQVHATISTTTYLNCDPKSTEYGQGHIDCRLKKGYTPVTE